MVKGYDNVFKFLFESDENLKKSNKLSVPQLQIRKRCLAIYALKLANPLISDKDVAENLHKHFDVDVRTIYNDLRAVETLICSIKKANKEYVRFMVTETQKYAIEKEKKLLEDGTKESTKDLSYASYVLAKAHNLDEIDPDLPEFDDLQPVAIEITDDITVIDLKNSDKIDVETMKRKYLAGYKGEVSDAKIVG